MVDITTVRTALNTLFNARKPTTQSRPNNTSTDVTEIGFNYDEEYINYSSKTKTNFSIVYVVYPPSNSPQPVGYYYDQLKTNFETNKWIVFRDNGLRLCDSNLGDSEQVVDSEDGTTGISFTLNIGVISPN